ncbi:hypothetical protein ABZ815_31465 [Nonomuraea sp. NPDC047529]|uniref:hypothetical protein n=1 Tax=Nonomuraea sp. NPDC047529 TaxID=3155623 RepID=UPI0033D43987
MKIELTSEAFTDEAFELIIELMRYFIESRHDWVVAPEQLGHVNAYFRQYAPKKAQAYALMAEKGMVSQAWAGSTASPSRTVRISGESLSDHVSDLGRPARFVVENQEGDRAFILALAYVFGTDEIVKAWTKNWLEFVQGGGSGEVPKVVKTEGEAFRRVKRVAFLLDSDRLTPEEPSRHQGALARLAELGVTGHILRFREAENYLPNGVLAAVRASQPELTAKIDCLKALSVEQRGYFDFKNGFWDRRLECARVPEVQAELFHSLPDRVRVGLRHGFGEGLTLILEQEAKAGKLKRSDFDALGPDVCEELQSLLALVRDII